MFMRVYLLTLVYRTEKTPWIKPTGPEAYRELKKFRAVGHARSRCTYPLVIILIYTNAIRYKGP
jgi:hypothetical protein